MHARFIAFGQIEIDGQRFSHDVVVEGGRVRRRKKGPSKAYRDRYGHIPLSPDEAIPWSAHRLIVGTGAAAQLPITPEPYLKTERRGIEIVARPTVVHLGVPLGRSTSARIVMCCGKVMCCWLAVAGLDHAR